MINIKKSFLNYITRVDLGVMALKEYSTFPKAPGLKLTFK